MEMALEMIVTLHIVNDEDGNLKIKQYDAFFDSKAPMYSYKDVTEAKSEMEHFSSHVA